MKVLIINYNRLTLLKYTADWCASHGLDPVIIDNNSDYAPLLDYYETIPYEVLRLPENKGHTAIWDWPILEILKIKEDFILTDPDLDFSGLPDDFLLVMQEGIYKYPQYTKCGLSLEINDLPDDGEGKFIYSVEKKYWENPIDDIYFEADTDTTFALYKYPLGVYSHTAIRTNRPYTVRHHPWYYRDLNTLPDDEQYYYKTANPNFSSGLKRLNLCGRQ